MRVYDTTIGWRFINKADEGAVRRRLDAGDGGKRRRDYGVSRADQDRFALASQNKAAAPSAKASSTRRSCRCRCFKRKGDPLRSRRTSIRAKPASKRWPS
jgi:acetyl-CoA acyltransferase